MFNEIYESKNNWREKTPVVLVCKNMHLDFEDFSAPFQLI